MKLKSVLLYLFVAPAFIFMAQSCDTCDESGTVTLSADAQSFSLVYLDTAGTNYVTSIYNPNNVNVLFNDNLNGVGQYKPYTEDLSDGKIGPFTYTATPSPAQKGVLKNQYYIIQKDTFGVDTLRIVFYPAVDECKEFWSVIEYYLNGELLSQYNGLEIAEHTITE